MANEKKRIMQLFFILSDKNECLSSGELSAKVNVSERTVKNDIKELAAFAQASGAKLHSKRGAGYWLEILDESLYLPVQRQLRIQFFYYSTAGFSYKEIQSRTNDILRRIIVEEDYITIDDIVEELYLTRSAIQEEMKEVNRLLKAYHLSFKKKTEKGPLIKGTEFDRRSLMICIFEMHYHEGITLFKSNAYLNYFERNEEERYDVRHRLLKVLRESSIHIIDDHTQRLARYLCIMASRFKEGHHLYFSKEEAVWIKQFPQYPAAFKAVEELSVYPDFRVDEQEVLGLALQFLINADIVPDSNIMKEYKPLYQSSLDFLTHFKNRIMQEYHLDISSLPNYPNVLLAGCFPILTQQKFQVSSYIVKSETLLPDMIRFMPLGMKLAASLMDLFKELYGEELSLYHASQFAEKIRWLFADIAYDYIPVKAAVTCQNGIGSSQYLAKLIEYRYPNAFSKLDCFELYEMRKLKKAAYDCVLLSLPDFSYRYEWPYLMLNVIPTQQQMNEIYNVLILKGVQLESIVAQSELEEIAVYRNFEFQDAASFIHLLSFKMGKDSASIHTIKNDLEKLVRVACVNKVVLLFLKPEVVNKNIFEIYQLKQNSFWMQQEVSFIVVMSIDFKYNLKIARFYENAAYELLQNNENVWKLIENPTTDQLIDLVRRNLKAVPFSLK